MCHCHGKVDGLGRCRVGQHHAAYHLRPSSVPARGDPTRGLSLPALHAELPRCRGALGRTWDRDLVRNCPALGCEVRPRLRPQPPPATAKADRHVALERDGVSIQGRRMYLGRAVDSEGEVLDLQVQPKRDTAAALRLMRKLLKKQGYAPDELVTDKLGSYGAARRDLGLSCRHEQGLRKNNRASLLYSAG